MSSSLPCWRHEVLAPRDAPGKQVAQQLTHPTGGLPSNASVAIEMTGTTTFGAENLSALFAAHGVNAGGLLELAGQLVPEPENPADPNAVAVHVEGARVGYLPGYLAKEALHPGQMDECQVQLWGTSQSGSLRVRGWVARGTGAAAWPHDAANPPAVTTQERRAEQADQITNMVDAALEGGGVRAKQFKEGMVGKYHYLEAIEPIKQLKRDGRLDEALVVCYAAIEGAERARHGREPAPWYTEQAAIIHRKRGERAEEEAVLRRWLKHCPPDRRLGSKIHTRLGKLTGTAS